MKGVTPGEFQTLVAAEFDRQGWEYDLNTVRDLMEAVGSDHEIDGKSLSRRVSLTFLDRNGASREDVAAAIDDSVGGRMLIRKSISATLVITDNRYQVNLGAGAKIIGSHLNLGDGTQIEVGRDANNETMLQAVEALVRAGLAGSWNPDAARDLSELIEERSDVNLDDVRKITTDVIRAEKTKRGSVAEFLKEVAAGGLGGVLATGISAGLGELISQLPL